MKLLELFESNTRKPVVVFAGRFQPFHRGHYAVYKHLCEKFGSSNVWIATSNKTEFKENNKPSPLNFNEKKELIVSLYKIPERRIINCKNPAFSPKEVFEQYHQYEIIYISAVGEKDKERYTNGDFFLKLPDKWKLNQLKTLSEDAGYYTIVESFIKGISGTSVREALLKAKSQEEVENLFLKFFGKYDATISKLLLARLKEIK